MMLGHPSRLYPAYSVPILLQTLLAVLGRYKHVYSSTALIGPGRFIVVYITDNKYQTDFDKCIAEIDIEIKRL